MRYPIFGPGEKWGASTLVFSFVLILLVSCDTTRRAGRNSPEPGEVTGIEEIESDTIFREPTSVDTLETSGELTEVEGEPGNEEAGKRSREVYDAVLMLPFLTNRFTGEGEDLHRISKWSLNFYGGVKMGLDELRKSELSLRLTILDTEGSEQKVENILVNQLHADSVDLLIGPYRRVNIQKVAEYGKRNNINVVSPYSATSNLTQDNPNFIQVRPSLMTHCNALMRHALQHNSPQQIVLIAQDEGLDQRSLHHFQEAYFTWTGTRFTDSLEQLTIQDISEELDEEEMLAFMEGRDTSVFIVSAWNMQDESFVYSFLRKLELARQEEQVITVYGTPVWQEYDRIDMDYFEKMNIHISSHIFIDSSSPKISAFRRDYFNRFGTLPTEESYLGYDIIRYFGRMLESYGSQFQLDLEMETMDGLHTRFAFERVVKPTTTGVENPDIEQFTNKYVHILKFENYQFQVQDTSTRKREN